MSFPRFFWNCLSCDARDEDVPSYDYEIVECPKCGSGHVHKWRALDNLSREWSQCESEGHLWRSLPRDHTDQWCERCGAKRKLDPALKH